jgi:hypothetical protein
MVIELRKERKGNRIGVLGEGNRFGAGFLVYPLIAITRTYFASASCWGSGA